MHYSCSHGLCETVEFLIENGADINAKTDVIFFFLKKKELKKLFLSRFQGLDTPLMKAGLFRQAKIIILLMNCQGIDPYVRNYVGYHHFRFFKRGFYVINRPDCRFLT